YRASTPSSRRRRPCFAAGSRLNVERRSSQAHEIGPTFFVRGDSHLTTSASATCPRQIRTISLQTALVTECHGVRTVSGKPQQALAPALAAVACRSGLPACGRLDDRRDNIAAVPTAHSPQDGVDAAAPRAGWLEPW